MAKQPTESSGSPSGSGPSDLSQSVREAADSTLTRARQAVDQYMREAHRIYGTLNPCETRFDRRDPCLQAGALRVIAAAGYFVRHVDPIIADPGTPSESARSSRLGPEAM